MNSYATVAALSVSPIQQDHQSIQRVFDGSKWVLYRADGVASALSLLFKRQVGVVICERDLPPDSWEDLLERLALLGDPPPLIVTSRLADEALWAKALNLGAYDVLAKPFDRREMHRTVELAWLHSRHRQGFSAPKARKVLTANG
jgi:DNA-binding NtrC family response regulator